MKVDFDTQWLDFVGAKPTTRVLLVVKCCSIFWVTGGPPCKKSQADGRKIIFFSSLKSIVNKKRSLTFFSLSKKTLKPDVSFTK